MKQNKSVDVVECPLLGPEFTTDRSCNIPHLREMYIDDLKGQCTVRSGGCNTCIFCVIPVTIDAIGTVNIAKAHSYRMMLHSSKKEYVDSKDLNDLRKLIIKKTDLEIFYAIHRHIAKKSLVQTLYYSMYYHFHLWKETARKLYDKKMHAVSSGY